MDDNNSYLNTESLTSPAIPSLPFITRDMLKFGRQAKLELRVKSQATRAEKLSITGATRDGLFTYLHQTTNDRTTQTTTHGIPDIPAFISVVNKDADAIQGEIFVTLDLLIDGNVVMQLASGLVYAQHSISWPFTNQSDIRPGGGFIGDEGGANPAANVEATVVVPVGAIWRIQSIYVSLVTDANVANRRVHLQILPVNGEDAFEIFSDVDHAASLTRKYCFTPIGHVTDTLDDTDIVVPFPYGMILESESSIQTSTINRQAGDNFSAMRVYYEQWFTPT